MPGLRHFTDHNPFIVELIPHLLRGRENAVYEVRGGASALPRIGFVVGRILLVRKSDQFRNKGYVQADFFTADVPQSVFAIDPQQVALKFREDLYSGGSLGSCTSRWTVIYVPSLVARQFWARFRFEYCRKP